MSRAVQIHPSYGRKVGVFDMSCGLLVTGSTDKTIEVILCCTAVVSGHLTWSGVELG